MTQDNPNAFKLNIGPQAIKTLGSNLTRAYESFDPRRFARKAQKGLDELELKARVKHVAEQLRAHLPDETTAFLAALQRAGDGWQPGPLDAKYDFSAWPMIEAVGMFGTDRWEAGMQTLRQLTPLFSAEFAVRPFIEADTDHALEILHTWTQDPNEHVRRLVSEGTRPRLPWGMRLRRFQQDPSLTLPLLNKLQDDPSEYVRRSVANHLNDLAKDHPQTVVQTCEQWMQNASTERAALVRHALRSLVKAGDEGALAVLGYRAQKGIRVEGLRVTPKRAAVGEAITLMFDVVSSRRSATPLIVDYAIHWVRKNKDASAKVFKLKNVDLEPGATLSIQKKHGLKPITTRVYYSGQHQVDVLVNGEVKASTQFHLRA